MSNLTGKVSIYQRISDDKVTYRHVSRYDERLNPLEYNTINYSKTTHRDTIYQATNQVESLLEKGDSTAIDRFKTGQEFDNLVLEEKYFAIDPTLFPAPEKERIDGTRRHTTNSRIYVVSGFDWDLLKSGKEFADEVRLHLQENYKAKEIECLLYIAKLKYDNKKELKKYLGYSLSECEEMLEEVMYKAQRDKQLYELWENGI